MKKWIALVMALLLTASLAACGSGGSSVETTLTSEEAAELTRPEVGRVKEMGAFYVYVPENWCQRTYKGNDYRIELFGINSAEKIQTDTPCVDIRLESEKGTPETLDANVKALLAKDGAKEVAKIQIDGYDFTGVTYTAETELVTKKHTKPTTTKAADPKTDKTTAATTTTTKKAETTTTKKAETTTTKKADETTQAKKMVKLQYTVYTGMVESQISTVTVIGIAADDENVTSILNSISYK